MSARENLPEVFQRDLDCREGQQRVLLPRAKALLDPQETPGSSGLAFPGNLSLISGQKPRDIWDVGRARGEGQFLCCPGVLEPFPALQGVVWDQGIRESSGNHQGIVESRPGLGWKDPKAHPVPSFPYPGMIPALLCQPSTFHGLSPPHPLPRGSPDDPARLRVLLPAGTGNFSFSQCRAGIRGGNGVENAPLVGVYPKSRTFFPFFWVSGSANEAVLKRNQDR